jgi:Mrp family chromosome partitioning ATPase
MTEVRSTPRPSLLDAMWSHRWLVLVCIVAGAAGGWYAADQRSERYVASTEIVLSLSESSVFGGSGSASNPDRLVRDELTRFSSPEVLTRTAELAGLSEGQVRERVDVSAALDHNALTIHAEGATGEAAAALAEHAVQAYEDEVLEVRGERDARIDGALTAYIDELQGQLDEVSGLIVSRRQAISAFVTGVNVDPLVLQQEIERATASDDELAQLNATRADVTSRLLDAQARLRQRQIDATVRTSGVALMLPAGVPDEPEGAQPSRYAVLGAALGALVAGAIAVTRSERRVIARSPREIAGALGVRSLGVVATGRIGARRDDRAIGADSHVAAGAVVAAAERVGAAAVVVASPTDATASAAVAVQLARTMAQRGDRVLLVEAGALITRRRRAGSDHGWGFADVAAGSTSLDDVLTEPVDLDGVAVARRGRPLDPADLRHRHLADQLRAWRERFDVVVITGGPLLDSPIGIELAALGGCVVLALPSKVLVAQLDDVDELLDARDVPLAGFVVARRTHGRGSRRRAPAPARPPRPVPSVVIGELEAGTRSGAPR